MKRIAIGGMTVILALWWVGLAPADMALECQTLVESCVAMFKEKGKTAALNAVDDRNGPFVKGDLYVFAIGMDNVILAHPHDKSIKRMSMSNVKDVNGKRFSENFREVATSPGSGWVDYTWAKPGEQEALPKRSYIMRVPGEDLYIGVGYYVK